jgi:formylglycine-generating enzyme required for sulfatase activity
LKQVPVGNVSKLDPKVTVITTDEILPQANAGRLWENSMEMRFAPLADPGVLLSRFETTHRQFVVFAESLEAPLQNGGMQSRRNGEWQKLGHDWSKSGFDTKPDYPVVGVTRKDAEQFCGWLTEVSRETGEIPLQARFRLPTDFEWGSAAGFQEHADADAEWEGANHSAAR